MFGGYKGEIERWRTFLSPWPTGLLNFTSPGPWEWSYSRKAHQSSSKTQRAPCAWKAPYPHLNASVPTFRAPQIPPLPSLPSKPPPRSHPWRSPPPGASPQEDSPTQGLPPGLPTPTPPGVAGWTSDSCSASSEGRGPLPVEATRWGLRPMDSAPGPSPTIIWSRRERGRQEVEKKLFQLQDTGRQVVERQARDRKEREGKILP